MKGCSRDPKGLSVSEDVLRYKRDAHHVVGSAHTCVTNPSLRIGGYMCFPMKINGLTYITSHTPLNRTTQSTSNPPTELRTKSQTHPQLKPGSTCRPRSSLIPTTRRQHTGPPNQTPTNKPHHQAPPPLRNALDLLAGFGVEKETYSDMDKQRCHRGVLHRAPSSPSTRDVGRRRCPGANTPPALRSCDKRALLGTSPARNSRAMRTPIGAPIGAQVGRRSHTHNSPAPLALEPQS